MLNTIFLTLFPVSMERLIDVFSGFFLFLLDPHTLYFLVLFEMDLF